MWSEVYLWFSVSSNINTFQNNTEEASCAIFSQSQVNYSLIVK